MRIPFRREPDPFAADRYEETRGARGRARRRRRRLKWAAVILLLSLMTAAGYAYDLYRDLAADLYEPVEGVEKEPEGKPFNVLLIGSDSRAGLTEEEQFELGAEEVGGERADTVIIAHVDPSTNDVTMVQFPRDFYVDIPGYGGNKISAALAFGGRELLVETVEKTTGLQINRYVQVNIAGFRDLVDAIGGVEVCVSEPIPFDANTGLEVEEPGMIHFDGDTALRFVRARKVFSGGDLARIQNQQKFLAAALNKITSVGTFFNLGRVRELVEVAGDNVKTTERSPLELLRLGQRFRSFDPDNYEAYTAPFAGSDTIEIGYVLLPDEDAMDLLFDAIDDNRSPAEYDDLPDIDPTRISVGLYNAGAEPGREATAGAELEDALMTNRGTVEVVDTGSASKTGLEETIVRYDPDADNGRDKAELVAAALPGAVVKERRGDVDVGVDVEVLMGAGFRVERVLQLLPIPLPEPEALPEVCRE